MVSGLLQIQYFLQHWQLLLDPWTQTGNDQKIMGSWPDIYIFKSISKEATWSHVWYNLSTFWATRSSDASAWPR